MPVATDSKTQHTWTENCVIQWCSGLQVPHIWYLN